MIDIMTGNVITYKEIDINILHYVMLKLLILDLTIMNTSESRNTLKYMDNSFKYFLYLKIISAA